MFDCAVIPDDDVAVPQRLQRQQVRARLDARARDRDVAWRGRCEAGRRRPPRPPPCGRRSARSPPSRPRTSPVSLSSTITIAVIAGSPRARLPGKTLTSLTPVPSSGPDVGRHGVDEGVGARMDGRLGRQLDRALGQADEHGARELGGLERRRQQPRDLRVAQPARLRRAHEALAVACERTSAASSRARAATLARSASGSSSTASPR